MAASPWAKSGPKGIFEFRAPAMFPKLRMGPATNFTTDFVPFFSVAVPQPPFSTKKVRKIKKTKFKLAFERGTRRIPNKLSRGALGEVKGRPFRR